MSFEPWAAPENRLPTMEQRFDEQTERECRTEASRALDRFSEAPLQCDDCGRLEEPGESFEDVWEFPEVLCPNCIDRFLEQSSE